MQKRKRLAVFEEEENDDDEENDRQEARKREKEAAMQATMSTAKAAVIDASIRRFFSIHDEAEEEQTALIVDAKESEEEEDSYLTAPIEPFLPVSKTAEPHQENESYAEKRRRIAKERFGLAEEQRSEKPEHRESRQREEGLAKPISAENKGFALLAKLGYKYSSFCPCVSESVSDLFRE